MEGKPFANYTIAVLLALTGIGSGYATKMMAQDSNSPHELMERSTNSSPPNSSYENVLKAARRTPITIAGKGVFFINSFFSSKVSEVDKVSIHIDGNQAFITFIDSQTQLSRTKVSFIGNLQEHEIGFKIDLQSMKFEQEVYNSDSKQFRLASETNAVTAYWGGCVYINHDIVNKKPGSFAGDLSCNTTVSGRNLLGYTKVENLPIMLKFRAINRK